MPILKRSRQYIALKKILMRLTLVQGDRTRNTLSFVSNATLGELMTQQNYLTSDIRGFLGDDDGTPITTKIIFSEKLNSGDYSNEEMVLTQTQKECIQYNKRAINNDVQDIIMKIRYINEENVRSTFEITARYISTISQNINAIQNKING